MVKTQFNAKIKSVRTDNGSEFVNINFLNLLSQHGILHQKTCAYTPQQISIVERKHRHLLQLARFLMLQASLPENFWPFSLLMATYIVNRLSCGPRKVPSGSYFATLCCFKFPIGRCVYKGSGKVSVSEYIVRVGVI